MDIFYGRKTHILLVLNGVFCSTLMWMLIQLPDIIRLSYIFRGAEMRTLKKYYHVGTVPTNYDQRS